MRLRLYPQLVTTDDRGQRTPLHILSTGGLEIRDHRVQAVRRRIHDCLRTQGATAGGAAGVCAAFGMPIMRYALSLPNTFAGSIVAAVCLAPFIWLLGLIVQRRTQQMIPNASHVLVNDGLCGACGYNLYGLDPEPDGCIPCPECGAAWSLARIKRIAPLDERPASVAQQLGLMKEQLRWPGLSRIDRRFGVDDRGLPTPLASVHDLESVHARTSDHAARAADAAFAVVEATRPRRDRWLAAFGVPGILLLVAAFVGPEHAKPVFLLLAGGAVLACYLLIRTDLIVRPATIIAAAKNAGICPACAQDLSHLTATSDQPIECPGCGAAWRPAPSRPRSPEPTTAPSDATPAPSR